MSGRTRRRELFLQIPGSHKQVNAVGKISAALTGARWWEQGGRRPPEPGRRPHRLAPRGRGPRPGSCRRRVWAGRRGTELSAQCDGTQAHSLCTHVATGRLPVPRSPSQRKPPSPVPRPLCAPCPLGRAFASAHEVNIHECRHGRQQHAPTGGQTGAWEHVCTAGRTQRHATPCARCSPNTGDALLVGSALRSPDMHTALHTAQHPHLPLTFIVSRVRV